jgi:hypothetical protein
MFIITIFNRYFCLLQTCPLCDIFSKIVWLEFICHSKTTRPRKLTLVANEASSDVDSPQNWKCSLSQYIIDILAYLNASPLCAIFSKNFWLEFHFHSRTTRPRKMSKVVKEASIDVDSALTLKMFIIAIFNWYFSLFQTGQFFTIFGNFLRFLQFLLFLMD